MGRTSDNFLKQDAVLGWAHMTNKDGWSVTREYQVPVRLNNFGLVGSDATLEKPASTSRIAFVGDSLTEAFQVAPEAAYPVLVEKRLNALAKGKRYEALNFGVTSYGTVKEAYVLEHQALAFKPDLVILGFFVGNDFSDNEQEIINPEASFTRWRKITNAGKLWLRNHSTAFRWFLNQKARNRFWRRETGDRGLTAYGSPSFFSPGWSDSSRESVEKTKTYLKNVQIVTEREKIPLLVLILPSKEQIQPFLRAPLDQKMRGNKLQRLLSAWLGPAGIPYLNLLPSFQSWATINPKAEAFFPLDGHPNEIGHRLIAKGILEYLKKNNYGR